MDNNILMVGDKSDHGGVIITGDPLMMIDGKSAARIGDLHSCPQLYTPLGPPHAITPIILTAKCSTRAIINGRQAAVGGDTTGCGASFPKKFGLGTCVCVGVVGFFMLPFLFGRFKTDKNTLNTPKDKLIDDKINSYVDIINKIKKDVPQKPPETPPDKNENCNCN